MRYIEFTTDEEMGCHGESETNVERVKEFEQWGCYENKTARELTEPSLAAHDEEGIRGNIEIYMSTVPCVPFAFLLRYNGYF